MSIHTKALKIACNSLHIEYSSVGKTGIFLGVTPKKTPHYFIANRVPLNNSLVAAIAGDKGHSYELLHPHVQMPRTLSFLDPNVRELYQPYVKHHSIEEIISACEAEFMYPFVVKKNLGSQGIYVFKCKDKASARSAFAQVFDQHSIEYDYIALAQEYVVIEKEYRVTVLNKKIEIIYQKDNSHATFTGNLSPLHWEGAKAVLNTDPELKAKLTTFIAPIYDVLDLMYGGLDIAIDKDGKMWLFEINSHPAYDHLIQAVDLEILVHLYKKILQLLP
jgi:glutathione synthase/RimK-type ligase-like ATP-grasp enzyme